MTHDLDLEIVRELHPPADHSSGDAAQARQRARVALLGEIARTEGPRRRWAPNLPRLRRRRRAAVLALSGAVAAAVGVWPSRYRSTVVQPSHHLQQRLFCSGQRAPLSGLADGGNCDPASTGTSRVTRRALVRRSLTPPCAEASASLSTR